MAEVEMEIDSVRSAPHTNESVVNLKEKLGERYLPIYVSSSQAEVIGRWKFENIDFTEQEVCQLTLSGIDLAESEIESVTINRFEDNIFYAKLLLTLHDRHYEVDCPPAIALILTTRAEAPIYAEEAVLSKAATAVEA